MESGTTEFVKN